jgi:hypothetical protein
MCASTGMGCLYSCLYRSKLRAQYDLDEGECPDFLVHFCCEHLALCQEYRELKNRGFDLGIGKCPDCPLASSTQAKIFLLVVADGEGSCLCLKRLGCQHGPAEARRCRRCRDGCAGHAARHDEIEDGISRCFRDPLCWFGYGERTTFFFQLGVGLAMENERHFFQLGVYYLVYPVRFSISSLSNLCDPF